MPRFVTTQHKAAYFDHVVRVAASRCRAMGFEYLDADRIVEWLAANHAAVHRALVDYLDAYDDWFALHEEIERRGGTVDIETSPQLSSSIDARDRALRRLEDATQGR